MHVRPSLLAVILCGCMGPHEVVVSVDLEGPGLVFEPMLSEVDIRELGRDYDGYSWQVDVDEGCVHARQSGIIEIAIIVTADDFRDLRTTAHCEVSTADHYVTCHAVYPTARDGLPLLLRDRVREGDRAYSLQVHRNYVPYTRVRFEGIRKLDMDSLTSTSTTYWLRLGDAVKLRQASNPRVQSDAAVEDAGDADADEETSVE